MTDISNFLLRWEIDNATATFATGKAESGVFDKGGFRWIARVERRGPQNGTINFSLQCDSVNNRRWKCEAKVAVLVLHSSGVFGQWIEDNFIYNENTCLWILKSMFRWNYLTDPAYMISDKVTMEFRINIISSQRGDPIADPETFTVSNRMSNVILKIGGRKLHVSKEYLAVHSPVFETLFFGDFAEKGKEEVEIKDVVYEEFVYLLNIIYVRTMDITDGTVQHILKLADQFQMEAILDQLKKYLSQSTGIDVVTKLILADQFRLVALRDHCLNSFNNIADLTGKLKSSPEYANFSDDMKARICDPIMKLNLQ